MCVCVDLSSQHSGAGLSSPSSALTHQMRWSGPASALYTQHMTGSSVCTLINLTSKVSTTSDVIMMVKLQLTGSPVQSLAHQLCSRI